MTLLVTVMVAVLVTVVWYTNDTARSMNVGLLCCMFWGASIMWFVDAIAEYLELRAEYFYPEIRDMINDTFLGISVIAFALVIWLVSVLVKDPLGTIRNRRK